LRTLRRFFFSPSAPVAAVEVLVAFLALSAADFAGALEAAVEAGALEAVEAGLGAMSGAKVGEEGEEGVELRGRNG